MIDWIRAKLPLTHDPLNGGFVSKINANGELEWETSCMLRVEGSHESSISIKSDGGDGQGRATHIWFSGNPSKFLQGHNVFGSDNIQALMLEIYLIVTKTFNLVPTIENLKAIKLGHYKLTMVDINFMFELPTYSDVKSWIRAAEYSSKSRHGRPSSKGNTVYWGKNSKRWALKAYSKFEELQNPKRQLPEVMQNTQLLTWSKNKLRLELRLLNRELDELSLSYANKWHYETPREIFETYLRKIDMTSNVHLTTDKLRVLPTNLQSTYLHWEDGRDLRSILPKTTYYRHRKLLLNHGINIDVQHHQRASKSNVVPLIKILEAKPVSLPSWAFQQQLIHASAKRA